MSRTQKPQSMKLRSQALLGSQAKVHKLSTNGISSQYDGLVDVTGAPSTPTQNGIASLRQRLEDHLGGRGDVEIEDNTSPGLARLRLTPGRGLRNKQELLIKKHEDVRQRADQLNVGGGISLWPQMDSMKLSRGEIIQLVLLSLGLGAIVVLVFQKLHCSCLSDLHSYIMKLKSFPRQHVIDISQGEEKFKMSLMSWHTDYRALLSAIHRRFDLGSSSTVDILFMVCYIVGVATLMYYLLDNMFAKSKLSPRRIKNWVCLLVVMGTWTFLMVCLLVLAHQLEYAIEDNVHQLSETLGDLVNTELDLQVFHTVLEYWRTRSLPPTTHGVLTVLGVLPVRDVMYYLQYYSLPVITVLVTPVVRLVMALYTVYQV